MQTCKSMLVGRKSAHLGGFKYYTLSTPPYRHVAVKAMASSADGKGSQAQQLFQQHKVLLGAGFSYDQAALILQVSQQRKAASPQLTSAGTAPTTGLAVARQAIQICACQYIRNYVRLTLSVLIAL
jgi:hypothetical protein